jgi:hypothetical protein
VRTRKQEFFLGESEVIDRNFRFYGSFVLLAAAFLSACSGNSVVSDSSSKQQPAQPAASAAPATEASAGAPATAPKAAAPATPTPTLNPVMKQASAQPGVPVPVPESMRRPLNAEEMQKAMQALPPEVRQRIMGMQQVPKPSPQPTKK